MYTVSFKTVSYGDDNSDEISVKLTLAQSPNSYNWRKDALLRENKTYNFNLMKVHFKVKLLSCNRL